MSIKKNCYALSLKKGADSNKSFLWRAEHNMMVKRIENRNAMHTPPPLLLPLHFHPECAPLSHLSIPSPSFLLPSSIPISLLKRLVNVRWELSSSSMASSFFIETLSISVCVCMCVCVEVEGNTIEQKEIEQDIENGKLPLASKGGHTHTDAERLEIELRMYSIYFILHSFVSVPLLSHLVFLSS